jgi:hypothetical protein
VIMLAVEREDVLLLDERRSSGQQGRGKEQAEAFHPSMV